MKVAPMRRASRARLKATVGTACRASRPPRRPRRRPDRAAVPTAVVRSHRRLPSPCRPPLARRCRATLCDWAERGFDPVAPGLNFIFSDLFNSLQIQKFV
jgi:hypothetical protein